MGILFVRLLGLLCLFQAVVAVGPCNNFTIYDGTREISGTNCSLYPTGDCNTGSSNFPSGLGTGPSVEKPSNFTVNSILDFSFNPSNGITYQVVRLRFSWNGPSSGTGRINLKGFYLRMMPVGSGNIICRLMDLQNNDFAGNTNLKFEFELFPLTMRGAFVVDLFSLPPPSDAEIDNGLYERHIVYLPGAKDNSTLYPRDWTTTISIQLFENNVVEVKFSLPHSESLASFDTYILMLVEDGATQPFQEFAVKTKGRDGFAVHNFTNIPRGSYFVQVRPNDTFHNIEDKCQCWSMGTPPLDFPTCDGSCSTTRTTVFNITGNLTDIVTSVTPPTVPGPSPSSTPHEAVPSSFTGMSTSVHETSKPVPTELAGLKEGQIIGVVIGCLAFLVMVLVVCFVVFKRKDKKGNSSNNKDIQDANFNNNDNKGAYESFFQTFSPPVIVSHLTELKVPDVKRKNVLLLAAEDHDPFNQAMNAFADFLETHCQCAVTFAPRQMVTLRKANSYCWLSNNIETADFVIIVTSEAAFRLYEAFLKGQVYKDADFGPEGDLFTIGIKHICGKIAQGHDVSKVVMVHFDHTSSDFRLPIEALPGCFYNLPKRLKSFLCCIHHLDSNKMDLSKVNLPLQGNVSELVGGKDWLDAVAQSSVYEHQHPEWFDKFGKPTEAFTKPEFSKQDSSDSGFIQSRPTSMEGMQRRLSSVSMQIQSPGITEGLEDEDYMKSHFFEPSVINSVYTIPYSAYTSATRPPEIDGSSTISEHMRFLNDCYEREQLNRCEAHHCQFPQLESAALQEGRSAISDQTHMIHADDIQFPGVHADYGTLHLVPCAPDRESDCISIYSAQSV